MIISIKQRKIETKDKIGLQHAHEFVLGEYQL